MAILQRQIPVFCSQGAEQWLSNHTHVMSSPNEITDCTNTLWHVQTAIPTGHVMAKATAESILDHIQPLPQQKRVIRLSGMVWKRSLMQSFPSRGHFWFTDHFGRCFFVLLHRHLRELKQRWCCLLKNKDIVCFSSTSLPPSPLQQVLLSSHL